MVMLVRRAKLWPARRTWPNRRDCSLSILTSVGCFEQHCESSNPYILKSFIKAAKLIVLHQIQYIINFSFCTGMSPYLSVGNSSNHSLGVLWFLVYLCNRRLHHRTRHGVWMITECFGLRQIWVLCRLSSRWISYWNLNQERYRALNNFSPHCVSSVQIQKI